MNRGAVAGVAADVRSGSKADIGEGAIDVRKRTLSPAFRDVRFVPIADKALFQ